jgi:hypothetical protein
LRRVKKTGILYLLALIIGCVSTEVFAQGDNWDRVLNLEGNWKFTIGDNKKWADPNYVDTSWEEIDVPAAWEDEGFYGYNGHAWYRKSFTGTALKKNGYYTLFMGYIDDVDEVYLNGKKIGSSGSFPPRFATAYNALRSYFIPNEYINFAGKNVIAVRVYDSEIDGGIVSGDIGIYTNEDEQMLTVNLRGAWDFLVTGRHTNERDYNLQRKPPENVEWVKVSVPALWEEQGFRNYDGSAWYRKQFTIPKTLAGEDLVLLMGKIDDFDQTYLNGKLIGSTNQYDKLRIYHITSDMINAGAVNLLMVFVDDPQGLGGIYEGPVGLMKQSEFTRYIRYKD